MLGRKTRTESNSQRGQIRSRMLSIVRSKWKMAVLCFVFIPVTIISATNLTTPTANAAVTIDQCVALNDKGRDAGSISKETYENSGVCNIMRRYTNLDKEQVKTDCGSKYGGTWAEFLGGWACNLIPLTDGVNSRNGTRTIDPSIQTEDECDSVNGIWTADGNFEGPGEMGTCQVTVGAATEGGEEEGEDLSCQIEGVGWIVCPIFNAIGSITDASYSIVDRLLTTPSSMLNRNSGGDSYTALNTAWSVVRNVANVAFVIAFLIIIYSQLTGRGMGNYGIKKMLPRLIISAILVNASFIISGIAVDISNVVGSGVSGLFSNMSSSINDASVGGTPWHNGQDISGNQWGTLVTLVVSGGAATLIVGGAAASGGLWLGIATLAPILVAALFAVLTVVIVLVLRQALIVLMIVVAPLAFVAFLLPNTENLFRKWMKLFMVLLAMFPAVALVFSVSKLAGAIVMASSDDLLVQIAGAGMTIIPLFITPVIMKTAGGTLNRLTGVLNVGAGKSLTARAKKMRGDAFQRVSDQRMGNYNRKGVKGFLARAGSAPRTLSNRIQASQERDKFKAGTVDSEQKLASNEKYRQGMLEEERIYADSNKAVGRPVTQAESRLMSQIRGQAQADEQVDVKNAKAEFAPMDGNELQAEFEKAIIGGNVIKMQAALQLLEGMNNKGVNLVEESLAKESIETVLSSGPDVMSNSQKEMRTELARDLGGMMGRSEAIKAYATKTSSKGEGPAFSEAMDKTIADAGNLSMEKFRNQTPAMQTAILKSGNISQNTLDSALDPRNIGSFDDSVVNKLKEAKASGHYKVTGGSGSSSAPENSTNMNPADKPTQAQSQSQPQTSQASSTKDGTLIINHDKPSVSTPSTSTANQSVSAKQAAPAAAQSPQPVFNPNQNQQPVSQPSGWTQTDSGLSVPRSAAQPAPVQQQPTVQQAAPAPVVQQVVQQPSPTQNSQPQKVQVELDTSGLDKSLKNAVNEIGNKPVVIDKGNFTVTDKRSGSQPSSFGSSGPSSLSSSKPTDIDGRRTPPTAPEDYHDRMSK